MTDVSDIPSQDPTKRSRAAEKATETLDKAGDALHEAADRAGAALHDAAGRAGEAIGERPTRRRSAIEQGVRRRSPGSATRHAGGRAGHHHDRQRGGGEDRRHRRPRLPGVYDLGGDTARLLSGLRERIGLGEESKAQGVSVKLDGKQADLSITLVVEYGFVVQSVCDKVREKAISSVENLLAWRSPTSTSLVDDVHVENDGPVGGDAERAAGYQTETPG